ncbi:MAG: hypothetical protein JOS17DRAFT_757857 [Linnemannia elongata]|nr:MAG: hypothetical protein JOS17DRAFT_757857 [Linnemannia elongata]
MVGGNCSLLYANLLLLFFLLHLLACVPYAQDRSTNEKKMITLSSTSVITSYTFLCRLSITYPTIHKHGQSYNNQIIDTPAYGSMPCTLSTPRGRAFFFDLHISEYPRTSTLFLV